MAQVPRCPMVMPQSILGELTEIANNWRPLAYVWHAYFTVATLSVIWRLRPTRRFTGVVLALPLLSAGALAWSTANLFSGTTFALSGTALVYVAARLPLGHINIAPWWMVIPGTAMFLFGWVYPHFLESTTPIQYLNAAPTGLVPCPTLSIVIGATLVLDGLQSLRWSLVLGIMGLLYGAVGVLYLSVGIDLLLFLGAMTLIAAMLFKISIPSKQENPSSWRL